MDKAGTGMGHEEQMQRLHGYLRAAGREPGSFGIEAWIRSTAALPTLRNGYSWDGCS
jgi:hypothetical protein